MDHDLSHHAIEIGGFGGCSCTSLPSFHDALIVRGSVALWNRLDVYWGCLALRVVWLWPLLLGVQPSHLLKFDIYIYIHIYFFSFKNWTISLKREMSSSKPSLFRGYVNLFFFGGGVQ